MADRPNERHQAFNANLDQIAEGAKTAAEESRKLRGGEQEEQTPQTPPTTSRSATRK